MDNLYKILETFELSRGMTVDLDEGWKKITRSQFGGTPFRGFAELVQNLLDSYGPDVPMTRRRGEIVSGPKTISITDYGEGMDIDRLKLLLTVGGTDKKGNASKIGKFGIGFFSIFNPALTVETVTVVTHCRNHTVRVEFRVSDPLKRPWISHALLEERPDFSTRISLSFRDPGISAECEQEAKKYLEYYPCNITINGHPVPNIWSRETEGGRPFQDSYCRGIIKPSKSMFFISGVELLCKYELVGSCTFLSFLRSSRFTSRQNLEDFRQRGFPVLILVIVTVNCDHLSLTISRDGYQLDANADKLVASVARQLFYELDDRLDRMDSSLILANIFVFSRQIGACLSPGPKETFSAVETRVFQKLSEARIFKLEGLERLFSLREIVEKKKSDLPLFYSVRHQNLGWASKKFRHEFIVLAPEESRDYGGADRFFDRIFESVFPDCVNLDHVDEDKALVMRLIERGIVEKEDLSPAYTIIEKKGMPLKQESLRMELGQILSSPQVRDCIANHLHLSPASFHLVFFKVELGRTTISTGLFDSNGNLFGPDQASPDQRLFLGVQMDHPLVAALIDSPVPHRAYFLLTYLSYQLVRSQKLLAPFSPFFNVVRENLVADLRRAMTQQLLTQPAHGRVTRPKVGKPLGHNHP